MSGAAAADLGRLVFGRAERVARALADDDGNESLVFDLADVNAAAARWRRVYFEKARAVLRTLHKPRSAPDVSAFVDHVRGTTGLRIPNLYGQPAILEWPELATAAETAGDAQEGDVGVFLQTWMCETFLSPRGAIALGEVLRKAGYDALRVEGRRRRA